MLHDKRNDKTWLKLFIWANARKEQFVLSILVSFWPVMMMIYVLYSRHQQKRSTSDRLIYIAIFCVNTAIATLVETV